MRGLEKNPVIYFIHSAIHNSPNPNLIEHEIELSIWSLALRHIVVVALSGVVQYVGDEGVTRHRQTAALVLVPSFQKQHAERIV